MRKHAVLSLALFLVFITAMSASAKTHSKYHHMHGDVESIDSTAGTFTVKHGTESSTFKTDTSTKFRAAGKAITLADLKAGVGVRVAYTEDGTDKTAATVDTVHTKKNLDKTPS
jgi:hypothetical protein